VAAKVDPVPERWLAAARGTYTWRTVDADVAVLAYDSVLDDHRAALVRGRGEARLLTFEAAELTIELEVTLEGEHRRIVGQLVPGIEAVVEVSHGGGVDEIAADRLGRFDAGPIEPGPVSLRCRGTGTPAGEAVITEWVRI
jgi:hypothetical protein